jgi:zinc protease
MRLQTEVKKNPVAFGSGGAQFNETFERFTEVSVHIESRSLNWMRALVTLEHELRRALRHGFTTSEVALSASTGLASYRYLVERATTRHSDELTAEIVGNLMSGRVTQAPSAMLAQVEPIFNSLTPQECLEAFRALWPEDRRTILVSGGLTLRDPAKEIGEIYESSRRFPLPENNETARDQFAYTKFGLPGKVAERTHVDDLDIHRVRFTNGVRLNLKRTDYTAGTIVLRLRIGGGLSTEPPDKPGLGLLAGSCFLQSGLRRHDSDAVNRIVRGSSLSLGFTVEDDALVFAGGADPAHLRLLLELITAYVTDPGWRPEGWASGVGQLGTYYSTMSSDTTTFANAVGLKCATSQDSRYGLPRFDDLRRRSGYEVKTWLSSELESGPAEIGIVGDMDVEAVIAQVAETLGTLPYRTDRSTLGSRPVRPPQKSEIVESTIVSRNPKATVWMAWVVPGVENAMVARRADVLSAVLGDRIRTKIREELGATYDASATEWESQADPRFGLVIAQMTTPPAEAHRLAGLMRQIAADIVKGGVTDDEFQRARQPILASLEQRLRDNSYWLFYVVDRAQEQPSRLDWPRTRSRDFRAMTRNEISVLGRECLDPNRTFSCIVKPKQ